MTRDVRQRLGRDPVRRNLDGGRKRRDRFIRHDVHREAGEPLGLHPQRRDEPELVERGWSQRVDQAPDVGDRGRRLAHELGQQPVGRLEVAPQQQSRRSDLERDPRERRPEAVVQIAVQAPAFLLAGRDRLLARALQVLGQTHGVRGHGGLPRDVVEQPQLAGGEPLAGRARAERELADLLAAVGQRAA